MNRSSLYSSPNKINSQLKNSSQLPLFNSARNTNNYTQIIIQTNDQEVPYVSIFKPNIKRQQKRIQSLLYIENRLRNAELARVGYAFSKIGLVKYKFQQYLYKVVSLGHCLEKLAKKRISKSFIHLFFNKIKKNHILVGSKTLNFFQNSHRLSLFKHSINLLKLNYYRKQVLSLESENTVSKQLSQLKRQLFQQKQGSYSKQLISKCKPHMKIIDSQSFINSLQENGFEQSIELQIKRFQEIRQEVVPKKKQLFQNQMVLNVMNSIQKAYQDNIRRHIDKQGELTQIIESYTNKEGIEQLKLIIVQKESIMIQLQNFFLQLFKLDSEIKRNQKQSCQKILNLLAAHQKKIQSKGFHDNSLLQKVWNSRVYFHSLIANIVKRLEEQKQITNKEVIELVESINDQNRLIPFIRKVKDSSLKTVAQLILGHYKKLKSITSQNQQFQRDTQRQNSSISYLLSYIQQIQQRINNEQQVDLQSFDKDSVHKHLQPILFSFMKIVQNNINLSIQNKHNLQLLSKRESIPFSQTKPVQSITTPQKIRFQSKQSQLSQLADHFLSPLKEVVQNRKDDTQLKNIMINCQQKIQQIINHTRLLQQKLSSLQTSDKIIQELTIRNNQNQQRIRDYQKENSEVRNELSNSQFKIRQLTSTNTQLMQQLRSLKQSFNQFNSIAHSNIDLTQKINQIYQKSIVEKRQQQQLMKQTELMKEIINHKIEFQNMTMNHYKELESLRAEINSYKTIITKLQTDLIQKEYQTTHLQSTIKSITNKYQEIKEINIEYKQKMNRIDRQRSVQVVNKFKGDQSQLNRLKDQCNNIYLQLQRQAQNINSKNYQIQSLQIKIREQEQSIMNLRQQKERLNTDFQDLLVQYSTAQQQISKHKLQITQVKGQYHSLQLEYHKNQSSFSHMSQNYQNIQNQLHQKQITINSLIQQAKFSASQLLQSRQQYANMQRLLQQKISQKDMKFSRLQFQINQKVNTITSLQQLISLYANSQGQLKKENDSMKNQYSRDKQIQYLCEQIKSLQEFVSDITLQYQQLEGRYQQERERTNRSFTSFTPEKHSEIIHHYRQIQSQQVKKNINFQSSIHNHSNILQNENDISLLDKLLANNENLSYSVDFLREENKELFMKVKNISSTELMIELVFNILLNIGKIRPEQPQGGKIWEDLCHMRAEYSGKILFANLQSYCSTVISKYRK